MNKPLPSALDRAFQEFLEAGEEDEEDKDVDAQEEPDTEECGDSGVCDEHYDEDDPEHRAYHSIHDDNGDGIEDDDEHLKYHHSDDDIDDIDSDLNSIASDVDDDEDDIDDLSDAELSALDAELSGSQVDNVALDGSEHQVSLSPDEQQEADDMMGVAATTILINDEMNGAEKTKFIESVSDVQAAVNEGLLLESDVNELATTLGLITEANNYNKKMIIRLDKEAKKKQLYAVAINVSAAAHHDPDYVKLKKINRMRKVLRAKLRKKYHAEAVKRMKVYFKRLTSSKSSPLAAIGKKLEKDTK